MSAYRYCPGCRRVHAFPRDMAERIEPPPPFRHLVLDFAVVALVIVCVLAWVAAGAPR